MRYKSRQVYNLSVECPGKTAVVNRNESFIHVKNAAVNSASTNAEARKRMSNP